MHVIKQGSRVFSDVARFNGHLEVDGFDLGTCEFVEPGTTGYREVEFATGEAAGRVAHDLGEGGGLVDLMGEAFSGLEVVKRA